MENPVKASYDGIPRNCELYTDVQYDLKFLDPEGEIYDETDLKELKALSGKVPTRFRIFNNQDVVMIRFEPDDKLGTYRVHARVYDKIGGKSVSLKTEIQLKE